MLSPRQNWRVSPRASSTSSVLRRGVERGVEWTGRCPRCRGGESVDGGPSTPVWTVKGSLLTSPDPSLVVSDPGGRARHAHRGGAQGDGGLVRIVVALDDHDGRRRRVARARDRDALPVGQAGALAGDDGGRSGGAGRTREADHHRAQHQDGRYDSTKDSTKAWHQKSLPFLIRSTGTHRRTSALAAGNGHPPARVRNCACVYQTYRLACSS